MTVLKDATGALALALVVRYLAKTQSKAPVSTITPLVPTSMSVLANPTGYLSGLADLKGLFTPPTVSGLKSVADPYYKAGWKPVVGKGGGAGYAKSSYDRLFAGGEITTLGQSFKLDLTGADLSGTFIQDFESGRI